MIEKGGCEFVHRPTLGDKKTTVKFTSQLLGEQ